MPATIKPRRGANLPETTIDGELLVDTSNKRVYVASGALGSNANLIAAAAYGATAGLIQFRGTNAGELLSSSLYGVTLSGSTPTAVYIGASGSSEIPLTFNLNNASQNISKISLRAPTTVTVPDTGKYSGSTIKTTNGNTLTYVFPSALPGTFGSREFWGLRISDVNTSTGVATLTWTNACSVCPVTIIDGTVEGSGPGSNNTWGQLLFARQPTSDDDPDATIIIDVADSNALRYDAATNTVITPKVQASDTIESTGLILKTGNTGKVKFVAESFVGSEVTLTVPSTAGGATLISTNSKISDLTSDTWTNISAKISSGKRGTGDVVQATSPLITTPTIETSLTLSGANPQIKASSTSATCDVFADDTVTAVNLGSVATTVSIGAKTGTVKLASETLTTAANIFTIGGLVAPTGDGNKDKGIQFRWHTGSVAKVGFFGYDDSSGKLIFVPDATITSDEVTAGAIGEINAKVEWANLLSVPSFATSSNNLGYFAATTSAQLAGVISDETGSGALVFGTSPSFTTGINAASTTMALFNTTATTINMGGAATAVNIGATGSGTVTIGHNLYVTNKIEASIKSFVIDHPTKQGKKLRYACLEGPENGVYVRGKLDGENTIVLPEYWVNLVDEETITVNLTGIDSSGYHTVKKIENNKITVQSSSGNVNCYYVVYGERKDVSKLVTEFE